MIVASLAFLIRCSVFRVHPCVISTHTSSFLRLEVPIARTRRVVSIHSSAGELRCVHFGAVPNDAAANSGCRLDPVDRCYRLSQALTQKWSFTGSCDHFMFNFSRNSKTGFQSACTRLRSHQQHTKVLISQRAHQRLPVTFTLVVAIQWVWNGTSLCFRFAFP